MLVIVSNKTHAIVMNALKIKVKRSSTVVFFCIGLSPIFEIKSSSGNVARLSESYFQRTNDSESRVTLVLKLALGKSP